MQYLLFDASKDGAGTGTWEAMANVRAADLPAVLAEVQQVLAAAGRHSPGPRGSLDEGGAWDGVRSWLLPQAACWPHTR